MQRYEIMYLVSPKTKDEDLRPSADQIQELVKKNGGKIIEEVEWGKKKLAYPINHYRHGFYYILYYDLPADKAASLENDLKLTDYLLRYLITKHTKFTWKVLEDNKKKVAEREAAAAKEASEAKDKDSKPKLTVEKISTGKPKEEKATKDNKEEKTEVKEVKTEKEEINKDEDEKKEVEAEEKAEAKKAKQEKKNKKEDKQEKAKLDELDKKLDEILDDEIIE